ncbi:MAG: helix-hairpin-helix domain-containing protein [Candidatus Limnocylindria bacterium]
MSRADRMLVAAGGGALVLVAAAAWMFLSPTLGDASPMESADPFALPSTAVDLPPSSAATSTVVVDVQGGVAEPGIRELAAGSRVADAIAAAGGYAVDADLEAAADSINLAQPLIDGGQVRVPRIGDGVAAAAPTAGAVAGDPGGGSVGGVVNLNTATPEELEALPGIGPVTVQKIVAARQERPFASLEDAVQRGVLNRGQLEDLQGLATAG